MNSTIQGVVVLASFAPSNAASARTRTPHTPPLVNGPSDC